jgi:hypothetical protein
MRRPEHLVPVFNKKPAQMKADETAGSGYQNAHEPSLMTPHALSESARARSPFAV